MKKEIIINATLNELRLAITEDSRLAELFIEMPDKERSIGNVFLGRVNKVIPGINAAFIDIGTHQDAFLHFSDVDETLENMITDEDEDEDDKSDPDFDDFILPEVLDGEGEEKSSHSDIALRKVKPKQSEKSLKKLAVFNTKRTGQVQINLEPGQWIVVQVVREAYGNKGVRVSTKIGIPGRYVVLIPFDSVIGISRKISAYPERKRLRYLARTTLPKGAGCIIRTAAMGKSELELQKDYESLIDIWTEIENKVEKATEPMLLYQDMAMATSVIRDLFTPEVKHVFIDSKKHYKEITNYLKWASPHLMEKVQLYTGKEPIFEAFGIEKELEITYKRKVNLRSGGTIVIDHTEAMVIIDVNSGRSISEQEQEKNAFKTNIEALREIARQVRLRDISGMVLIDFIDMNSENLRRRLFMEMKKELSRDRAKTTCYPLTQLSIMQLTRQRINQNIAEKMSETCPTCQGTGRIASKAVLLNAIERWLKSFRTTSKEFRLTLVVHPHVAAYLTEGTFSRVARLMLKYFVKIRVLQNELVHIDQFSFISAKKQRDITQDYL